MSNSIQIDAKTLLTALEALGETVTPVYSAHKKGNTIVIWLCNRTEPLTWKLPAKKKTTAPRKSAKRATTAPKKE